ncbi:MAG: hypothetical protein IT174_05945 [Acidobacteria bacterium]|nr:hypothetical protein [Acidobacteriota bacterium]MCC7308573.1 hypothetical protein [Acidobacteriota bacterium]
MSYPAPDENEENREGDAKPTITIAEKGGSQAADKETITIAEKEPKKP